MGEYTYDQGGDLTEAVGRGNDITLAYDLDGHYVSKIVDKKGHREVDVVYTSFGKPSILELVGTGSIFVAYNASGEIDRAQSDKGSRVAIHVASAFSNLLDAVSPAI